MADSRKAIDNLFKKYLDNNCSRQEFDELLDLVDKGRNDDRLKELLEQEWNRGASRSFRQLSNRWLRVVAAVLLLLTVSLFIRKEGNETVRSLVHRAEYSRVSGITRVKLPDGSTVMLRGGSRLNLDSSFAVKSREVTLLGEAFFDVVADPEKPFIIHTGKVKTTVLGTAFTIKANPSDPVITVTVTRGKVKVEDERSLLATLEADRELVYHTTSNQVTEKEADNNRETEWKPGKLVYRNSTFEEIVQEISLIYEVQVLFEEERLKHRQITATLDLQDSLESILEMLCVAQGANFVKDGERYLIKSQEE
jgi:transmembrane sensor